MALLFIDGFEAGDMGVKWQVATGTTSSTDTRFATGRCAKVDWGTLKRTYPATTQVFIGFAFKVYFTDYFLQIYGDNGATLQLQLHANLSTGIITLYRGTTAIASSGALAIANIWGHYLEISATINSSTGNVVVKSNGNTIINFTGNTKNGGTNNSSDAMSFGHTSWQGYHIDDLYIADATGSSPYNTFLGDIRIHTLVPDGAGSLTQMTPSAGANYTTVDELTYSAIDYVRGSAGQVDLYTAANLPAGVGTIFGVQANAIVKKTDAGSLSGRTKIKTGATTANGATTVLGTTDLTVTDIRQINPDTSSAWTTGDVNSIEVGMEAV